MVLTNTECTRPRGLGWTMATTTTKPRFSHGCRSADGARGMDPNRATSSGRRSTVACSRQQQQQHWQRREYDGSRSHLERPWADRRLLFPGHMQALCSASPFRHMEPNQEPQAGDLATRTALWALTESAWSLIESWTSTRPLLGCVR